jgi:chromosome segregation ATPase
MPPEDREVPVAADTLRWLQDEVQNARAQAGKLEQQTDQLQALFSDLAERSRHHDALLAALAAQLATLASVQEGFHKLQTQAVRLREEQERTRAQAEEVARQHEAEGERARAERAEVIRQLQEIERQVASSAERQSSVEEVGKRYQEAAALAAQHAGQLEQRLEETESRTARSLEAINRFEQKLPEVEVALENAVRATETSNERTRLVTDVIRRVESEVADLIKQIRELSDLPERLDLQRVERQRLEARFSQLEETVNALTAGKEEHQYLLSALDGKHHGYEGRLDALSERLEEYRQQLGDYLLKLTQSQEQLKRRQIGDLEREIKELEQHALGLFRE